MPSVIDGRWSVSSGYSVLSTRYSGLSASALFLLQRGVDCGVGADFVVGAVGPALDGEILDIDSRHAALAHHDFAEDVAVDRHGGAEKLVLAFIRRRDRRRQLHREGHEGNLLLQFAEGGFVHANAAQVVAE